MTTKRIRKTRFPSAAVLCLLLALPALAGDLEVRLDRTSVDAGESVRLLIRERGAVAGEEPDLSPLRKDFDVLDVSQSQRMQMLNGDFERSHDWIVTLAPQRTGRLEVPSLKVGGERTQALELEVGGARAPQQLPDLAGDPATPTIFLEAEVDDRQPFVQGRSVLTLRVNAREGIVEAALAEPEVPGAIVERIGEDTRAERTIGGERYDVIERRYSVVPQQSGRLEIAPVALDAVVREAAPPSARRFGGAFGDPVRDFFGGDPFGSGMPRMGSLIDELFGARSRRVRVRSEAIALDVKPVPGDVSLSQWLPARALELSEEWSPDPAGIRVGEQVTRTVTMRGAGVAAVQLPDLDPLRIEGLKQYPEPTSTASREAGGELWSVKQQASVLVPTQPGPLTLPPVEVSWYDVEAKELRTASLPARTLEVLPAPGGSAPQVSAASAAAEAHEPGTAPTIEKATAEASIDLRWVGGACAAALLAAGAGLALYTRRRRIPRETSPPGATPPGDVRPRAAAAAFERACRANDPGAAATALVAWGRARWPDGAPNTPGEVAARLGGLRAEVDALNAVRYSAGSMGWQGDALLAAWREACGREQASAARASGALPALYPTP